MDTMRKKLMNKTDTRNTFTATFERFGTKQGWQGTDEPTVLFSHVRDTRGNEVCDHLWFSLTKGFNALNLQHGDVVRFDARASRYVKGYRVTVLANEPSLLEFDYKLSYPTRVTLVTRVAVDVLPQPDYENY